MRTKNIITILAALALCWFAASCAKQNDIDSYKETTDSRFGTVKEQIEYLNGVLETVGKEQVVLEAYLEDLEEASNVHAAEIDSLMDNLDGRVEAVQDTLENFARKDSMQATFATLGSIETLSGVLAAIEVKVKADSTALTDTLENRIAATEAKLTEKFKSYYTKSELGALIKAQSDRIDTLSKNTDSARTEIAELQKSIGELQEKHAEISTKLDAEIAALKGTDADIEESIKTLDAAITAEFQSLEPKVTANTQAIAALEVRVQRLELRVQSIEVVPDYANGGVDMVKKDSVGIRFEVRPRYLIDSLAGKDSLFSFQIIKTTAATKAGIFDTITVQSVTTSGDEDSLLIVTVNGTEMPDDFFAETQPYSARLVFSDGNTDRASAYFPLMPVLIIDTLYFNGTTNSWDLTSPKQKLVRKGETEYLGYVYLKPDASNDCLCRFLVKDKTFAGSLGFSSFTTVSQNIQSGGESDNLKFTEGEGVYYVSITLDGENSISAIKINNMNLVGDFNGWNVADDSQQMTWNAGTYCWEKTGAGVTANGWKFAANNAWDINLGGTLDNLTPNGANLGVVGSRITLYPTRINNANIYCTVTSEP